MAEFPACSGMAMSLYVPLRQGTLMKNTGALIKRAKIKNYATRIKPLYYNGLFLFLTPLSLSAGSFQKSGG
jgi:hypothetical protein